MAAECSNCGLAFGRGSRIKIMGKFYLLCPACSFTLKQFLLRTKQASDLVAESGGLVKLLKRM